jgi:hypothetical protein
MGLVKKSKGRGKSNDSTRVCRSTTTFQFDSSATRAHGPPRASHLLSLVVHRNSERPVSIQPRNQPGTRPDWAQIDWSHRIGYDRLQCLPRAIFLFQFDRSIDPSRPRAPEMDRSRPAAGVHPFVAFPRRGEDCCPLLLSLKPSIDSIDRSIIQSMNQSHPPQGPGTVRPDPARVFIIIAHTEMK